MKQPNAKYPSGSGWNHAAWNIYNDNIDETRWKYMEVVPISCWSSLELKTISTFELSWPLKARPLHGLKSLEG